MGGRIHSGECQIETKIIMNRYAKQDVNIIPVWFESFDKEYDNRQLLGRHYLTACVAKHLGHVQE